MVLFSEISASDEDMNTAQRFDAECDEQEYEAKIAKLFRRSYAHDKGNPEERTAWATALQTLRDQDFYGLVMIDQAGIPRPKPYLALLRTIKLKDVSFVAFALGMIGAAVALLSDRFPVARVLPDWLRIVLCGVCVYLLWFVGGIYGRASRKTSSNGFRD